MFEKYNEKARRALFFARYEASKLGSRVIESEHILLGVLREGEEIIKEIFSRFNVKPEQIRREVEGDRLFVDRISSSAELPLSEESKKILAYAAHEAESMLHQYVGTEHLLIGILRVESSTAARILTAKGLNVYGVREETISILKEREADKQKKELPFITELLLGISDALDYFADAANATGPLYNIGALFWRSSGDALYEIPAGSGVAATDRDHRDERAVDGRVGHTDRHRVRPSRGGGVAGRTDRVRDRLRHRSAGGEHRHDPGPRHGHECRLHRPGPPHAAATRSGRGRRVRHPPSFRTSR